MITDNSCTEEVADRYFLAIGALETLLVFSPKMPFPNRRRKSGPRKQSTEYVDSAGKSVDISKCSWMTKILLPYINVQEVYRKIQDEVVREMLPRGTRVMIRVNCTDASHYADDYR